MKKWIFAIVLLLAAAAAAWLWQSQCGGVSHRELKTTVTDESAAIQAKVDARFAALDAKLDRIESKLDKLIDMATPKLPDGMKAAE